MATRLLHVDQMDGLGKPSMGFDCVTRSHIGCRRKLNEDAILSRDDLGLWAVADGMGGHEAGDVASAMIVDLLGAVAPGQDLETRIDAAQSALQDANGRLVEMGKGGPTQRTIGSTIVVMAADKDAFSCVWVGDSRAYRMRDGNLQQITRDHSLVQKLVDSGILTPEEAHNHPNGNVVTRAIGAADFLDIDLVRGDVWAGDVFLLASDGLTRIMMPDELQAGLRKADLEAVADDFVDTVLSRGAPDNLSFVILRAI